MPERKLMVLVVEDNETNRKVLTMAVESLGGEVRIAENGAEAVSRIWEETFDLVLMDLAMPIMNGMEATDWLRKHGVAAPIIAVTAHMRESDLPALLEKGFNDIIPKPISITPIAEAMALAREVSDSAS